ncbi:MAG: carbohydrate-binding domain-containing protein [Clostridiales bacterium]|nr:carbohydrate-binding domain-containing protein [Clostridiales bacterium]
MKNLTIRNKLKTTAVIIALALLIGGCSQAALTSSPIDTESTEVTESLYSDRDYETSYDESDAISIELQDESITITEAGTYIVTGTLEDGSIVIDAGDEDKIQLVLAGCSITSSSSACIYVKNADKVFITTEAGTVNTLTNTEGFEADGDINVDGVIFAKDDLTLNGEGTLVIESCDHGIVCKDELIVTSGVYDITSAEDGLQANDLIAVSGGSFTINAGDDAMHSEVDLVIDGGNIDIPECKEGLEGNFITINGGDITIIASDDAVNAAGDQAASLEINGGTIDITTYGDGMDSNGTLSITDGYITISGPENAGNGSLDYDSTGSITGGTIIAAGMSGMEMNFSEASQGSILISTGAQSSGTTITITDSSGNEILSYTPTTSYSCVLISSPELEVGQTYTITSGSSSQEVTLSDYIYGQTMGMGGFGGPGGNGFGGGQMPGDFEGGEFDGQMPGGGRGRRGFGDDNFDGQTPPELPDDFDGETPPEPPEGFDGQTPPDMPQ